jgi:hypothetical protein
MSNLRSATQTREKLGSLALVIKEQTDFSVDNVLILINKGNKQAAKRAGAALKARKKAAKQYRAESMEYSA